jgi:hypothetical protein
VAAGPYHHRVAAWPPASQSHRLCDARSPRETAAWSSGRETSTEEKITVPAGAAQAGTPAARARTGATAQAPRRLGLALEVVAATQVMAAVRQLLLGSLASTREGRRPGSIPSAPGRSRGSQCSELSTWRFAWWT